jgi:hypothetical protein
MGPCEHGNEPLCSIYENNELTNAESIIRNLLHEVSTYAISEE